MVELVATLMKHPYAEGIFNASFMALNLDSLFPWEVTHYLNRECKSLACLRPPHGVCGARLHQVDKPCAIGAIPSQTYGNV